MWCPEAVWAVLEAQPCVCRSVNLRVCFVCVKSSAGSQQARARSLARSLPESIPGKPAATPVIMANSIRGASAAAEPQLHRGAAAVELADALDNASHVHVRSSSFLANQKDVRGVVFNFKSAR